MKLWHAVLVSFNLSLVLFACISHPFFLARLLPSLSSLVPWSSDVSPLQLFLEALQVSFDPSQSSFSAPSDFFSSSVSDISVFQREPEFYAYGMLCALTVCGIWQILSSYMSLNTSSTHSISKSLRSICSRALFSFCCLYLQLDPSLASPLSTVARMLSFGTLTPLLPSLPMVALSPLSCPGSSAPFSAALLLPPALQCSSTVSSASPGATRALSFSSLSLSLSPSGFASTLSLPRVPRRPLLVMIQAGLTTSLSGLPLLLPLELLSFPFFAFL